MKISAPGPIILTERRSSISSAHSTMGFDVISHNSGFSNRIHDSASTASGRRIHERNKRWSKPTASISITTRSVSGIDSRRRSRNPRKSEGEDLSFSAFNKERAKKNRERKSIFAEKSKDADDSGKTEHTDALTEYSRRQGSDNDLDAASLNEQSARSSCGHSIETSESRFQSLLDQWKTRERDQKERAHAVACDTMSRASYLSEDEDHSCFEGVLKHWKKRDNRSSVAKRRLSMESRQNEVIFDDEMSEVSSLGDSMRENTRWGFEGFDCDEAFDFRFDARFDSPMEVSSWSPCMTRISPEKKKKKKKKKSDKKREGSKSKKKKSGDSKGKKKKTKSCDDSYATFDAAMDAAEAAMDATVATMDESIASINTTGSKKKKKKKSKSKSKKTKSKKSPKKSQKTSDTPKKTKTDVEGSYSNHGVYLPNWLSPQVSPRKSLGRNNMAEIDWVPVFPNLVQSPNSKTQTDSKERLRRMSRRASC